MVNATQGTKTLFSTKKVIIVIVVTKAMAADDLMAGGGEGGRAGGRTASLIGDGEFAKLIFFIVLLSAAFLRKTFWRRLRRCTPI